MPVLEWSELYSVGIPAIDNEHKVLVSLVNDMSRVIDTHIEFQTQLIGDTLNSLIRGVQNHFDSEEKFLLANNYPEYGSHKTEHTLLLDQLEHFKERFKTEKPLFTENMLLYLQDWLVRHIILHDCKFGSYFRDNGMIVRFG